MFKSYNNVRLGVGKDVHFEKQFNLHSKGVLPMRLSFPDYLDVESKNYVNHIFCSTLSTENK